MHKSLAWLTVWVLMGCGAKHEGGPPDAGPTSPDAGVPSAFQCEGVPAPSDPFIATYDNCVLPEGTIGSGYIHLDSQSTGWAAATFIYPNYVLDSHRVVRCGDCEVRSPDQFCAGGDRGDDANAGTVALSAGGRTAEMAYTNLHPRVYARASGEGRFFDGGETLVVSTDGGSAIGAFTRELPLPSPVTVTAPPPSPVPISLQRGADVDIRWTGGGAGYVDVLVRRGDNTSTARTIQCRFAADAGTGTLPGDLLRTFEPGSGTVEIWETSDERFRVPDWTLEIRARMLLDLPDGGPSYVVPIQLKD